MSWLLLDNAWTYTPQCEISHNILTALSQQELIVLLFSPASTQCLIIFSCNTKFAYGAAAWYAIGYVNTSIQPHAMAPLHEYPPANNYIIHQVLLTSMIILYTTKNIFQTIIFLI